LTRRPWATSAAVGKSLCAVLSEGTGSDIAFPQAGFVEVSFLTGDDDARAFLGWGCMTLPAWGSWGTAGAGADGRGGGAFDELDGVLETGGVAELGRDQPGPAVDNCAVDVSLAETSLEWKAEGGGAGRGAAARVATTEAAAEEDEFFWRNFLFMLTALKRLGWGMAKGDGAGA
jgi:hypothetical protein